MCSTSDKEIRWVCKLSTHQGSPVGSLNLHLSELHFITDTGRGHRSDSDRKVIRSHVMKGKNLGRWRQLGSKPSQMQLKQLEEHHKTSNPDSCVSQASSISGLDLTESPTRPGYVPRQFGSVASTMSLADSVEPSIFDIVLRCRFFITPQLKVRS